MVGCTVFEDMIPASLFNLEVISYVPGGISPSPTSSINYSNLKIL